MTNESTEFNSISFELARRLTAVSTDKFERMGRLPVAECYSNFLELKLPCDRCNDKMRWENYLALRIRCVFFGDSLRCFVTRKRFVGLTRLRSSTFYSGEIIQNGGGVLLVPLKNNWKKQDGSEIWKRHILMKPENMFIFLLK